MRWRSRRRPGARRRRGSPTAIAVFPSKPFRKRFEACGPPLLSPNDVSIGVQRADSQTSAPIPLPICDARALLPKRFSDLTVSSTRALGEARMTMTARVADLTGGRPVVPSRGVLRPLGLAEVRIAGGFWGQRQATNASASLDHALGWM